MKYKNLLFSSVGDKTDFYKYWCNPNKNYDIYLCYYGTDNENKYREYCDFYIKRNGSKFQNFNYVWLTDKNIRDYERYFILDDDILISTTDINELFEISNKYKLSICQPSFDATCNNALINHEITKSISGNILRYVNFIEVNSMLFSYEALYNLMTIYDNSLVGWGIDWLAIWINGQEHKNKYAIIDKIKTINPKIRKWTNNNETLIAEKKEIDILQDKRDRFRAWYWFAKKNNIKEWKHQVFNSIKI